LESYTIIQPKERPEMFFKSNIKEIYMRLLRKSKRKEFKCCCIIQRAGKAMDVVED
jgi:hypothetical protein